LPAAKPRWSGPPRNDAQGARPGGVAVSGAGRVSTAITGRGAGRTGGGLYPDVGRVAATGPRWRHDADAASIAAPAARDTEILNQRRIRTFPGLEAHLTAHTIPDFRAAFVFWGDALARCKGDTRFV
jgi:hypothetical protein